MQYIITKMHKLLCKKQYPHEKLQCTSYIRVVNGPTSSGPNQDRNRTYKPKSGPNPKTNLMPKSCPKKTKVQLGLKNLAMLPSYFNYIFVRLRLKVRLKPEIFVNFRPESDQKNQGRLTTLSYIVLLVIQLIAVCKYGNQKKGHEFAPLFRFSSLWSG